MLKDLLDYLFALDKSEYSHLTLALGAGEGINLIYWPPSLNLGVC